MSKNIVIQEGGLGKQLTADKLKTNLVGGGTCLWVPEDETQLGTKSVSENGTYKASDDGLYGYSEFTVSGVGSVTGRDPESGEEKHVTVDPETGEIVETVLPTEIRITTPPTQTSYTDGEAINLAGAVIKAYSANEEEMQVVPLQGVIVNPTSASYGPGPAPEESQEASIDDTTGLNAETIAAMPFVFGDDVVFSGLYKSGQAPSPMPDPEPGPGPGLGPVMHTSPVYIFTIQHNGFDSVHACSKEGFSGILYYFNKYGNYSNSFGGSVITINGQNVYTATLISGAHFESCSPAQNNIDVLYSSQVAYVILYGTHTTPQPGSAQTITVSWPRPGDGKVLETTFEIIVQSSLGGATGGGGEAGETGAGRND